MLKDDLRKCFQRKGGSIISIRLCPSCFSQKYMVNYTYDSAGQLIREDNGGLGTSVIYTYDGNGNIQYKHEYPYTLEEPKDCCGEGFRHYAYDTVHRDRLVAYEGEFCEYDKLGNPTKYRQKPLKWERCRLLASFDKGVNEVKFTYDGQGQRRTKQAGPRKWRYVYDGMRLVRTVCETVGAVTDIVDFNYDAQSNNFVHTGYNSCRSHSFFDKETGIIVANPILFAGLMLVPLLLALLKILIETVISKVKNNN